MLFTGQYFMICTKNYFFLCVPQRENVIYCMFINAFTGCLETCVRHQVTVMMVHLKEDT